MISLVLLASALMVDACGSYVDEDYIRDADEVFLGLVLSENSNPANEFVRVAVISTLGGRNPGYGDFRDLEISADSNNMWSNISSALSHNDKNYIDSGFYSSSSIFENPGGDGCYITVHVTPQVMYLFIQGSEWRRRSVEPVLLLHDDAWVDYVRGILQP